MTTRPPSFRSGPPAGRRPGARRAGDLVPGVLRNLGLPSRAVGERLERAWRNAAEPAWASRTRLRRIEGGVLEIGVSSAPLREELAQFHHPRLLQVLRTALPDVPLVGLHFVLEAGAAGGQAWNQS